MTPIAAYYIFMATEHERAAATHDVPPRRRLSPLERVRSLAAAVRPQGSAARSARTA